MKASKRLEAGWLHDFQAGLAKRHPVNENGTEG